MSGVQMQARTDVYAAAEVRLGRALTLGERAIDIAQLDRDLNAGKARLAQAVDKEKRRALNAYFRYRRTIRLHPTEQMQRVLRSLYHTGQAHARAEIRQLTGKRYARTRPQDAAKLASLVEDLRLQLHRYERKVTERAAEMDLGHITDIVAQRAVLQMPGAMNVASQLVTGATYGGMGSIFDEAAGLFTGFDYSAVMDDNTCDPCAESDGDHYDSWEEIQQVLPDGGPNPDCDGEGRCRCRAVPSV